MRPSSRLGGSRSELLANICLSLDAGRYISPPGARIYLGTADQFSEHGIEILYHEYAHPVYRQQHGEFEPYLSVIDLLLNEGGRSLDVGRSGIPDRDG